MLEELLKPIIPEKIKSLYRKKQLEVQKKNYEALKPIVLETFKKIISENLGINGGDVVLIHSSLRNMKLEFSTLNIIGIIKDIVGPEGTILFPTYPQKNAYKTLLSDEIFDIKKSPSYTGIISEFARRSKAAVRSLHPTKSVCAIGPHAKFLLSDHHKSPFPYDVTSPYYKINAVGGKIIGIGVKTTYLSCVHCVDDIMGKNYPVNPYHPRLFTAQCKDYDGTIKEVQTYAHRMFKIQLDLPGFFQANIDNEICEDINYEGVPFFRADAKPLYEQLTSLAEKNITIYKKIFYKPGFILK